MENEIGSGWTRAGNLLQTVKVTSLCQSNEVLENRIQTLVILENHIRVMVEFGNHVPDWDREAFMTSLQARLQEVQ